MQRNKTISNAFKRSNCHFIRTGMLLVNQGTMRAAFSFCCSDTFWMRVLFKAAVLLLLIGTFNPLTANLRSCILDWWNDKAELRNATKKM